jgi:hypothetical protein
VTRERDDIDQMTDEEAAETAEIRAEIEETRVEMGGTLNELGERLEPGHLIDEAKDNVREATIGRVEDTARGISDMVMETIKRNPLPAAMAGAGLALLWANRSNGNGTHYRSASYGSQPYGSREQGGIGDKVGEAASTVGETVTGTADRVGYAVGRAGENIGQAAGDVGSNLGSQLDRILRANPLAVAAVAAGAGAIMGTLLPETPQEREMLGDASRQVGIAVRDAVDEATTRAEDAIERTEAEVNAGA